MQHHEHHTHERPIAIAGFERLTLFVFALLLLPDSIQLSLNVLIVGWHVPNMTEDLESLVCTSGPHQPSYRLWLQQHQENEKRSEYELKTEVVLKFALEVFGIC